MNTTKNFKNFIKTEKSTIRKEKINSFIDGFKDNTGAILTITWIGCVIFSLFYLIIAEPYTSFDSKIIALNKNQNEYINDTSIAYSMDISYDNKIEIINLSSEEYDTYNKSYVQGVTSYKYEYMKTFYKIVMWFLLSMIIFVLFIRA